LRLKYVKQVRAKGRDYLYFDTGKVVDGKKVFAPLPSSKSPDFGSVYAVMLGHRNRQTPDTTVKIPELIDLYQKSRAYAKLAANSRRVYDTYLLSLEKALPTAPVALIERIDFQRLFDKMGDRPGAANMFLATSSTLFAWGIKRGYLKVNPCDGIDKLEGGEHEPWPAELLDAALVADSNRVRLLTNLLYYTAQRVGDVLRMSWSDITDAGIRVRQQKTGKSILIPLHKDLKAELAKVPRQHLLIVTTGLGTQLHQTAARSALQDFAKARCYKIVPHGLRKNAVIALLEIGCTMAETASISGQSLKMVEHYAKARDQEKLASAAILRWERNG
jgi:integrase